MGIQNLIEEFNEYSSDRTIPAEDAMDLFDPEVLSLAVECGIVVFIPECNHYTLCSG